MAENNSIKKYIDQITEVNKLSSRVSTDLIMNLGNIFKTPQKPEKSYLEIVIKIKDKNVNVRQFSSYLALVDRLYGRLSPNGLRSYARRQKAQLKISEFRKGSLELVIQLVYEHREVAASIMLVLFLKFLPNAVKSVSDLVKTLSESTKNMADSYKSYQEARLVKENRETLRKSIDKETSLKELPKNQKDELTMIQETLYEREKTKITLSKEFADKYVEKISLRIRKKK